MLKLWGEF